MQRVALNSWSSAIQQSVLYVSYTHYLKVPSNVSSHLLSRQSTKWRWWSIRHIKITISIKLKNCYFATSLWFHFGSQNDKLFIIFYLYLSNCQNAVDQKHGWGIFFSKENRRFWTACFYSTDPSILPIFLLQSSKTSSNLHLKIPEHEKRTFL